MGTSHARPGLAIRAVLSLALLAGMTVAAPAATVVGCEPPPTPFNMTVVGHSGGLYSSVETTGNHLLAIQGNALVSYNTASGSALASGTASAPEPGAALYLDGDRAYAVGINSFGIYDITDPGAPVLLSIADMPSPEYEIVGFFASGDYAYAGYEKLGSFGTKVFCVEDPATASVVAYSGLVLTDMRPDAIGGRILAVNADGEIDDISLADPTNPVVADTFGVNITDADVDGGYLYAAIDNAGNGGVAVYDVDTPLLPAFMGSTPTLGMPGGKIAAAADRVWRITESNLELWNTATKSAPAKVEQDAVAGEFDLAAAPDFQHAYVATGPDPDGVTTIQCFETESVPGFDTLAWTLESDAGDAASVIADGLAYVISPSGLRVQDLVADGMPILGECAIVAEPTDVSVDGLYAAIATEAGLTLVDVTDPMAPAVTDDIAVSGGLTRVALKGTTVYGAGPSGLFSFSLSNPAALSQLDSYAAADLTDLDARDDRVWVTQATGDTSGYVIEFDAANPANLVRTADHGLPSGMPAVTVTTETAYVGMTDPSWGGSAVKTFDISEPGTLYYTNWIDAGAWLATDVFAKDGILLTAGDNGVQQLGVYDPSMPYQMGFSPASGERVAGEGDLIAVSSAGGGTTYLRYDPVSFRTFGGTRFDTAIAMSQTFDSSEYVVLATGRSYPDALAGVPLAYALNAPILLTEREYIPDEVVAEIERLGATKAIVLGGTSAVSQNIVDQLGSLGMALADIERISGATRYETARAIALRLQRVLGAGSIDKAFVATGLNFPDALAAAGAAAKAGCPILLVKPGDSNAAALAAISSLGIDDTVIVGGTAVVPADIAARMPSPERLSGANRYETAVRIANWSLADADTTFDPANLFVVTGTNFPDALACGVVAAGTDAPTLLVGSDPPAETLEFIRDNATQIERVDIVGGDAAVSSAVEHWLVTYVK